MLEKSQEEERRLEFEPKQTLAGTSKYLETLCKPISMNYAILSCVLCRYERPINRATFNVSSDIRGQKNGKLSSSRIAIGKIRELLYVTAYN